MEKRGGFVGPRVGATVIALGRGLRVALAACVSAGCAGATYRTADDALVASRRLDDDDEDEDDGASSSRDPIVVGRALGASAARGACVAAGGPPVDAARSRSTAGISSGMSSAGP